MEESKRNEFKDLLNKAIGNAKSLAGGSPIDLARLGGLIKNLQPNFVPQMYGHEKLRPLVEEFPEIVELIRDDSIYPPRYFAHARTSNEGGEADGSLSAAHPTGRANSSRISRDLNDFALIIQKRWLELADLALKGENWGDPKDLPLLRGYVRHTFTRLAHEEKIKLSQDGEFAAFNTGLVDQRYQPIYALCKKNQNEGPKVWFLDGFCVAGENFAGKRLVTIFKPLPEAAYYFSKPSDAIYDITAGPPYIDWEHVIEENGDRIPPEILERTTRGFEVKSCKGMKEAEVDSYKQSLSAYLKTDSFAYRQLIDTFNRALDLALKKVRWNYKTAIPVYYPTFNKLSMLLPLCLLSEDHVDVALVVEKTDSGNYLGHTIYPLSWAYSNARLIARPDSDWLRSEDIETA